MSNFCQFKTAYLIPVEWELSKMFVEETAFDVVENERLPEGWELVETGISGCAGFILIFQTYEVPTQKDLDAIDKYLKELEAA